ncbi:MAG: YhfC family intramembrane metalloprotease, partial [Oscillospiraceae bacterium]|nr:YhfC family intramembrane metalloprotease [Oscillospiraceae bacterium]
MIPTLSFVTCAVTLFISLILPVAVLILLARKWKLNHIPSAWFLGALGFFIPQMLIRTRLLEGFAANPNFQTFVENHYILYCLILAFTAGAFELAGRYGVAKVLKRDMTFRRSLAAGLGHGGIEAMILIGSTYINNMIYMVMIQTGSFAALIAQGTELGVDVSQLYAVQEALAGTSPWLFLVAGYERLLTMICHAAMSLMVCWGVWKGRPGKSMIACLIFHTLLDSIVILQGLATPYLGNVVSQNTAYVLIYALMTVAAI